VYHSRAFRGDRSTAPVIIIIIIIMAGLQRHYRHDHPFASTATTTRRTDRRRSSGRLWCPFLLVLLVVISSTTTDAFASIVNKRTSLLQCLVNLQGGGGGGSGGEAGGAEGIIGHPCGVGTSSTTTALQATSASASSSSSSSTAVREVKTTPISGMRPGTSGLRKKVEVWQGEHYVENFIQALIDTAAARSPDQQVPDTYVVLSLEMQAKRGRHARSMCTHVSNPRRLTDAIAKRLRFLCQR
jgi:hypothetical protein